MPNSAAYSPGQWTTFFSVAAGASSGLAGLLFVAVSLNLAQIVGSRHLVARTIKALALLIAVLLLSLICLVPGQSIRNLGGELALVAMLEWLFIVWTDHRSSHKNEYISARNRILQFLLAQWATLPFVVAGISLTRVSGGGLDWFAVGVIGAIVAAVLDAWVLLIEIQR